MNTKEQDNMILNRPAADATTVAPDSPKTTQSKQTNKRNILALPLWLIFLLACLITTGLYGVYKSDVFSAFPAVSDFIIDNSVLYGANITGEWNLFWNLTWIGCFVCLFLCIASHLISKKYHSDDIKGTFFDYASLKRPLLGLVIFLPALVQSILYADSVLYLWLFSGILYYTFVLYKDNFAQYFAMFLFVYFDLQVIVTLLGISGLYFFDKDSVLFAIPAILFVGTSLADQKFHFLNNTIFDRAVFILQIPLPLLLLIYLKQTYQTGTQIVSIGLPVVYACFIALFIAGLWICHKHSHNRQKLVSVSSVLAIFLYGSYMPAAQIVPTDLHHYGEQMLPFEQIVLFGSKAYGDYAPVSGLFPMIPGFFNAVLFQNKATTFYLAYTIFMFLFATLIIFFVCKHIKPEQALLFALLIHMPTYCRTWIILPALLLLMLPKVMENKRRFLYLYVFIGFVSGLYYPLFGLAIICATLPYAFAVCISYFREKAIVADVKNKNFYIETLLLVLPIAISAPMLLRMAGHVLAYSHQTLLADGLALSVAEVPEWFIPYLRESESLLHLRASLYHAIRFIGPMSFMFFSLLILCRFVRMQYVKNNHNENAFSQPAFLGFSAVFIILPVCYTYTMVIMDESWVSRLFSRSGHVFLWIFGLFLPIVLIKFGHMLTEKKSILYSLIACSVCIGTISFSDMRDYQFPIIDGTTNSEASVIGQYTDNLKPFKLPDDMILVSIDNQIAFPSLGNGFIQKDVLKQTYDYQNRIAILKFADPNIRILGLDSLQMYYDLLDEKALYSGKPSLAKSIEAASMVYPFIDEHTVIGKDIKPLNNYYIYRAMMKSGFVYDPITDFYVSKQIYCSLYGESSYHEADHMQTPFSKSVYMAKAPAVLAHNISTLQNALTKSDTAEDFLYVKLDKAAIESALSCNLSQESILTIGFTADVKNTDPYNLILADYEDGEWLIPIGANEYVYNSRPDDLYISVFSQDPSESTGQTVLLTDVCSNYQFYALSENRR